VVGDIVAYDEVPGEHQRVADEVVLGDVTSDLAVVGVHVVDGKSQVAEMVSAHHVVATGDREDAVPAIPEVIVQHLGAWRVPDGDPVARLAVARLAQADDDVVAHHRIGRSVEIHPEEIVFEMVVLDHGAARGLLDEDSGIHRLQRSAGPAHLEPAHDGARRGDRDNAAFARPDDDGTFGPGKRDAMG